MKKILILLICTLVGIASAFAKETILDVKGDVCGFQIEAPAADEEYPNYIVSIDGGDVGTGIFVIDAALFETAFQNMIPGVYEQTTFNDVYTVSDFQIKISGKRLHNRHYKNYRQSEYTLSYNANGELESIEADIKDKWPFPQSVWKNEEWQYSCNF